MILEVSNLCKRYNKKEKYAITDINIHADAGEVVGIVGHNGAGKSSTIKCLTGMHPYDEGKIIINGYDLKTNPVDAKANFGYVSDVFSLYDAMTGIELINFVADIYNVSKEERIKRIAYLDDTFKLGESINKTVSSYSHGMKQKISLMAALIHEPKLFILDEPMVGLDPYTIKELQEFFISYARKGNAVVFSSHNLDVVKKLCDRVYVIDQGVLIEEIDMKSFDPNIDILEYFLNITKRTAKVLNE